MVLALDKQNEAGKALAAAQDLTEPWKARNDQWVADRRLLMMSYRKRILPFELILSNDIAVQHTYAVAILGGKSPLFRLPISLQEQAERDKMNRSERLLYGIWREADRNYRAQGHGPMLHEFLAFAALGAICAFPRVDMVDGHPRFYATLYDPINCYPEFGEGGLLRFARVYSTTYADAYSLARSQGWDADQIKKSERVDVVNLWEKQEDKKAASIWNTVVIGGVALKPRARHEEFAEIPIVMRPMNGLPTQPFLQPFTDNPTATGSSDSRSGAADWGRPVFWMNRELVPALDRNLTYSAEISRRTAFGKYVYISEGGMQVMSPTEFEATMVLNLKPDEDFRSVAPPSGPRERETVVADLQNKRNS